MSIKLISETPPRDRPRERLGRLGAVSLSTAELIAVILGTGDSKIDALALAHTLLRNCGGSLRRLARKPNGALTVQRGIGQAKAARLMAACELARRIAEEDHPPGQPLSSPATVFSRMAPRLRDLPVEEFHVLCLDAQNRLAEDHLITRGILNGSLVHAREVFRAAISEGAAGIIAVHNHPSGDPTPSQDDRSVTAQLVEAGKILDIPLYDHVVVGADSYFSFAEAGFL